ncbi:MAG: hypothetical protein ACREHD_32920 [Pirellulales bacterium]
MNSVQLDENSTSKKLFALCKDEGKVSVKTFPRAMRNKSVQDPDVVDRFLKSNESLVTTDHRMPIKQAAKIPNFHAGIIIVRNNGPHTQREKDILEVLRTFKDRMPKWEDLNWSNSIVELYQDRVEIYSIRDSAPSAPTVINFDDADFVASLQRVLAENATCQIPTRPLLGPNSVNPPAAPGVI